MKARTRNMLLIATSALVTAGALGFAAPRIIEPEEHDEQGAGEQVHTISFYQAPDIVRAMFSKLTNEAKPTKVEQINDEEVTKYEIEYSSRGMTASVTLSDHGEPLEMETPTTIVELPDRIVREIKKDYPGAKIMTAEAVQLFYYEMEVQVEGKTVEVAAFATGDIEDRLLGDEENADHDGKEHADHDEHHGHKSRHEDEDGEEDDD